MNPIIEIQVASLLMHAWSEVEHDLAYKVKKGNVSFEEYEALDEINGLVIAGEIALQRLQRITQARIREGSKVFSSHYQLANFLYEKAKETIEKGDIFLGDVESLYILYEKTNRISFKKVENDLEKIDFSSNTPVAQQLIDLHTDTKLRESQLVIANKSNKSMYGISLDETSLGLFLKSWIRLEKQLDSMIKEKGYIIKRPQDRDAVLRGGDIISPNLQGEYYQLKKIRNKIVHGLDIPTSEDFNRYVQQINDLISYLN